MEPLTIKSLGFLKWFQEDLKIIIITIILRTLVASPDKPQGLAVVNIIYLTMVVD